MRLIIICLVGFWAMRVFSAPTSVVDPPMWVASSFSSSFSVASTVASSTMDSQERTRLKKSRDHSSTVGVHLSDQRMLKKEMEAFIPKPVTEPERSYSAWSPWGMNYFNWATQRVDHTMEGGGRLESYNFIGVTYRLNGSSSLSFRPTFGLAGAGKNSFSGREVEAQFYMGDTYIQYLNWNLALLPGDIGVIGKFRVYIPTSEGSSLSKKYHIFSQLVSVL